MKKTLEIGIDVGVKTGIAEAISGKLTHVGSGSFWCCIDYVKNAKERAANDHYDFFVYVEDPRLRKWFSGTEQQIKNKRMGVGSVKRDATLWEDFLNREGVPFMLVAPKNNKTKLNQEKFKALTGWKKRTNEHGRDAAMLIFRRK